MTARRTMWVSMQVSIHVCITGTSSLGGGLSDALYSQIWSKCIFKKV